MNNLSDEQIIINNNTTMNNYITTNNFIIDKLEDFKLWLYFDVYQEFLFNYKSKKIFRYITNIFIILIILSILLIIFH